MSISENRRVFQSIIQTTYNVGNLWTLQEYFRALIKYVKFQYQKPIVTFFITRNSKYNKKHTILGVYK